MYIGVFKQEYRNKHLLHIWFFSSLYMNIWHVFCFLGWLFFLLKYKEKWLWNFMKTIYSGLKIYTAAVSVTSSLASILSDLKMNFMSLLKTDFCYVIKNISVYPVLDICFLRVNMSCLLQPWIFEVVESHVYDTPSSNVCHWYRAISNIRLKTSYGLAGIMLTLQTNIHLTGIVTDMIRCSQAGSTKVTD